MKKYLIGFVLGCLATSVILVPVLLMEQTNKFEFGRAQGSIDGVVFSAEKLRDEFGTINSQSEYTGIYSVKTTDVVAVEINGVKTVRVID